MIIGFQFMFGASAAMVYGLLMRFNVVYTLFFAVTIVCLARSLFSWGKWLLERRTRLHRGASGPAPGGGRPAKSPRALAGQGGVSTATRPSPVRVPAAPAPERPAAPPG